MRPLPSRDLYGQTSRGKPAPKARRSRRRKRIAGNREARLELRVDVLERELWIKAAAREGYLSLSDWMRDRLNGAAKSRALMSSIHEGWNTPPVVIDALKPLGPIALDPCSNEESIVPARAAFTKADDGLSRSWRGAPGLVYVNPPYGDELPKWILKCIAEAEEGAEIVALVPGRSDTQWWDRALSSGAIGGNWRGRLTFQGALSPAPFPSTVFYWGRRSDDFTAALRARCTGFVSGA